MEHRVQNPDESVIRSLRFVEEAVPQLKRDSSP
jgi:hypothetical protein